jgi:hypothetical protein
MRHHESSVFSQKSPHTLPWYHPGFQWQESSGLFTTKEEMRLVYMVTDALITKVTTTRIDHGWWLYTYFVIQVPDP